MRVIHYTPREIMWERKENLHCECHGVHDMQEGRDWPHSKNGGSSKLDYAKLLTDTYNVLERHRVWSKIFREYSIRVLAFGSDLMPALSEHCRSNSPATDGQIPCRHLGRISPPRPSLGGPPLDYRAKRSTEEAQRVPHPDLVMGFGRRGNSHTNTQ
jgi:hypothetical protein